MKYAVKERSNTWLDVSFQLSSAELMIKQRQLETRIKPKPEAEELKKIVRQTSMKEAVQAFLKKENVTTWGNPRFSIVQPKPGDPPGLNFISRLALLPEVVLPDYSQIKLEVPPVAMPTEEAAQLEMYRLRYQLSNPHEVSRPIKWGDIVDLSFVGFDAKQQPIPLSARESQSMIVNGALFYPGFMQALIGKAAGEPFEVQLQAPEDYFHPPVRNQTISYRGQVLTVFEPEHALTDAELLKRLDECPDMETLYRQIAEDVLLQNQKDWNKALRKTVVQWVSDQAEVALTNEMIEAELRSEWERLEAQVLQRLGYGDDVLAASWQAWQAHEELFTQMGYRLKDALVLRQIALKEQLVVEDEETMAVMMAISDTFGGPSPEDLFFEMRRSKQLDSIVAQMESEKAIDFLMGRLTLICEGAILLSPDQPAPDVFSSP